MTNQERLDLEVILRRAAFGILDPYTLYVDDNGGPTFRYETSEGISRENYIANHRSTVDLKNDLGWLFDDLHDQALDRPVIEAWFRQYEVWRNK